MGIFLQGTNMSKEMTCLEELAGLQFGNFFEKGPYIGSK